MELATPNDAVRGRRPRTTLALVVVVLLAVVGGWALYADVWGRSPDTAASSQTIQGAAREATADAAASDDPLPATLAGLDRTSALTGTAARQEVEQLHGKVLGAGLDGAWVVQYGGAQATVWVSRSVQEADARQLLDRMTAKIQQAVTEGRSPFTPPVATDVAGVTVYELDGMSQRHGYFLIGSDLYWVAMPPALAAQGIGELVAAAR